MYFFFNFIEVIVREISTEELLDPNGPYVTKNIRVCWLQHNFIVMCNSKYYCSLLKPILQAKKIIIITKLYYYCCPDCEFSSQTQTTDEASPTQPSP